MRNDRTKNKPFDIYCVSGVNLNCAFECHKISLTGLHLFPSCLGCYVPSFISSLFFHLAVPYRLLTSSFLSLLYITFPLLFLLLQGLLGLGWSPFPISSVQFRGPCSGHWTHPSVWSGYCTFWNVRVHVLLVILEGVSDLAGRMCADIYQILIDRFVCVHILLNRCLFIVWILIHTPVILPLSILLHK